DASRARVGRAPRCRALLGPGNRLGDRALLPRAPHLRQRAGLPLARLLRMEAPHLGSRAIGGRGGLVNGSRQQSPPPMRLPSVEPAPPPPAWRSEDIRPSPRRPAPRPGAPRRARLA